MKADLVIVAAVSVLALAASAAAAQPAADRQAEPAAEPPVVETATTQDPDRVEALLRLLAQEPWANPTEVSVDAAQAGVRSHPRDPDAWHQLGESLEVAGRIGEAAEAYERATRLPPRIIGRAYLYRDLARAREQAGDLQAALAAARVSVRSWPLSRDGLLCSSHEAILLTRLLVRNGDLRGAADFYRPLYAASTDRRFCPDVSAWLPDAP